MPVKAIIFDWTGVLYTGRDTNWTTIHYITHELKPHYKIGLLSNISRDWIQEFFDEHQLNTLFDAIVLSSTEGIIKPEVEIFHRVAERLTVKPGECVMIDDTLANCEGARLAGMHAILYKDFDGMKQALQTTLEER